MSDHEVQLAFVLPPLQDRIAVIDVGVASAELDLTTRTELLSYLKAGRFITFIADAAVYFNLGSGSGGTVAIAAVSGATQGWFLPAGQPFRFTFNADFKWLRHIAPVATKLRVYVSSRGPTESV